MGRFKRNKNDTSNKAKRAARPKREKMKNTTGSYKGIEYESLEELAMLQWLYELKNAGYIHSIKRAKSYLLCSSLVNDYALQLKTKSKPMQQTILHGHSYTPEFEVEWESKASKFVDLLKTDSKCEAPLLGFYGGVNKIVTYIEVKPVWDQNNMERLFKVNQKWMWEKHGIFVNLVKPQLLFQETFTPKEYHVTPSGRVRIIKWKPRTLTEYLSYGMSEKGTPNRRRSPKSSRKATK